MSGYAILTLSNDVSKAVIEMYRHLKKQPRWFSGAISSKFEKREDKLLIELNFELVNGYKDMSIWLVFLKIMDPLFPQLGTYLLPQDFKPINLDACKTETVNFTFIAPKPETLDDTQNAKGEELKNQGIHAELLLFDNERKLSTAPLFIYEGGLDGLSKRIGTPSPQENHFIITTASQSWLESGKQRGNKILKMMKQQDT